MKTYLDCIACFFKQALEGARLAGVDEKNQKKILDEVARELPDISIHCSPPEIARGIYRIIEKYSGLADPYLFIKKKSNKLALSIYDRLKEKVSNADNSLMMAVELAIAGNIIDYGVKNTLNVEDELEKILDEENQNIKSQLDSQFNFMDFEDSLKEASNILYLADNAGETVFDRLLIEEIKKAYEKVHIIYAVKEKPIINDALKEDAIECKIDSVAEIISSGSDAPGTVLSLCSESFINIFNSADMVISKGQGNYEALSNASRPVFFLFMAKCPMVARHARCNIRDIILKYSPGREERNGAALSKLT
ncbi:MAG: ARMT1-like domain-containing protein [Candidatus Theseobacter exili]|nr:ARMT1-like domain-containing protein [Candidatus Theseobacter exili]